MSLKECSSGSVDVDDSSRNDDVPVHTDDIHDNDVLMGVSTAQC